MSSLARWLDVWLTGRFEFGFKVTTACCVHPAGNMRPSSCDTFVALPLSTEKHRVIFGKNSDRPCDEVQEVVYFPARDYDAGEKVEVSDVD